MLNHVIEGARQYVKNSCRDRSCEMRIGGNVYQSIIIDVEKYWIENGKPGKVCDCLILCVFYGRKKFVVVELKGRSPDVSAAVEKIQNVCDAIRELLEENLLHSRNFDFYPILLSKGMGPIETKKLRASIIHFQHRKERIIREHCNISLARVFRKYG